MKPCEPQPTSSGSNFLVQRTGPLTSELLLQPGKFGLGMLPQVAQPDGATRSVCGFCATGCALDVHLRGEAAIGLTPSSDYPVNLGMACPKGWEALEVLKAEDRATTPLLKNAAGKFEPIDWPRALQTFVERFKKIQTEAGPHSIAFLSTGQIPTEEMAFLGSLAKFGMGLLHGDGNTRQCMATSVVAYKQAFGFDAPPYTYADFEQSDVIVLVGSNLCIAHPILWQRVLRNPHQPQIVVIDPRTTETAMSAQLHLPVYPKSDLALLYGVAKLLIDRGWIDAEFIAAHTTGFAEFVDFVAPYTLEMTAQATHLPQRSIEQLAELIHRGKRVSFWWTMGVNQSHQGVRTAQAIINLALMTGNIGRPGTGANSITGQCNAMGSRLFSNTTNLLGGHDFANPEHRAKVASVLGIDPTRIPSEASKPYHQILEGVLRGDIRGLWIIATNPAHSWINQGQARDILSRLDFLVVQDMYHTTETAQSADLVLPAAGWGEKSGTFINSERRISACPKVARSPGLALADFHIFRLIAEAWGCGEMFARWDSPAAVFESLKALSAGQPCDFSGIDNYLELQQRGGMQWPWPQGSQDADYQPERRLFADGKFYHPDGRAKFLFQAETPIPEAPSQRFPLVLNTGRGTAAQWHTQTRTGKSAVLRKLAPEQAYVEMHPHDAQARGIRPGDGVLLSTQRGTIRLQAMIAPTVQPGQVFVPMHYQVTNVLTDAQFDPYSHQPAYKSCAAQIQRAPLSR